MLRTFPPPQLFRSRGPNLPNFMNLPAPSEVSVLFRFKGPNLSKFMNPPLNFPLNFPPPGTIELPDD